MCVRLVQDGCYNWNDFTVVYLPIWQAKSIFEICDLDDSGKLSELLGCMWDDCVVAAVSELRGTCKVLRMMYGYQPSIERMEIMLQDAVVDESVSLSIEEYGCACASISSGAADFCLRSGLWFCQSFKSKSGSALLKLRYARPSCDA